MTALHLLGLIALAVALALALAALWLRATDAGPLHVDPPLSPEDAARRQGP